MAVHRTPRYVKSSCLVGESVSYSEPYSLLSLSLKIRIRSAESYPRARKLKPPEGTSWWVDGFEVELICVASVLRVQCCINPPRKTQVGRAPVCLRRYIAMYDCQPLAVIVVDLGFTAGPVYHLTTHRRPSFKFRTWSQVQGTLCHDNI